MIESTNDLIDRLWENKDIKTIDMDRLFSELQGYYKKNDVGMIAKILNILYLTMRDTYIGFFEERGIKLHPDIDLNTILNGMKESGLEWSKTK